MTAVLSGSASGPKTTANPGALTALESKWPASATSFRHANWVHRAPRAEAAISSYTNPTHLLLRPPPTRTRLLRAVAMTLGWDSEASFISGSRSMGKKPERGIGRPIDVANSG